MMRACWLEIKRSRSGVRSEDPFACVSMNLRNASIIASEVFGGMAVITDMASLKRHWRTDYDIIFVGYSTCYTEYNAEVRLINANPNSRLMYVTTDYECRYTASLWYSNRPFEQIANTETPSSTQKSTMKCWKNRTAFHFVNLNALCVYGACGAHIGGRGAVYYGQYRPDRERYFRLLPSNVTISTKPKNAAKFKKVLPANRLIGNMRWDRGREHLRLFDESVWIEDTTSHLLYNCPPNRFYEALNCGVIPRPHDSVRGTIAKSGYNLPQEWYWSSAIDPVGNFSAEVKRLHAQALIEKRSVVERLREICAV